MIYIPSSTLIHSAQLGDKNWATSAVVAFKVRSERTVMSCSRPMLPAAKEASSAPSSVRIVVVAFRSYRSAAALCNRGVSTKLVAVREFTVKSAVGSTPGLFSRSVTRWPRLLKFAMRG